MDLLHLVSQILAFILLIQSTASDSSIVAKCRRVNQNRPSEWYEPNDSNPSPIHKLTAALSESLTSVIIRWAINIDGSISHLTGTWINVKNRQVESNYRCRYEPPFTSNQINLTGLQQLWFDFTVPNVCPSNKHDLFAYNIPTPPPGTASTYYGIAKAAEVQWKPNISAVDHGDKVVVTFSTISVAEKHIIQLKNKTQTLATEKIGRCKEENCKVELEYTGPCENLNIRITPHFENCEKEGRAVQHKVQCKKVLVLVVDRSMLMAGVGVSLGFLLLLVCCCVIRQGLRWSRRSKRGVCVRVLLVYPAVDGPFQRSVLLLAELLQSRGGVSVVIDMWDKISLAAQGPLRWINTQSQLADRVLLVRLPRHTGTGDVKSNPVPGAEGQAVSASANNLFSLALNLLSSAALEPRGRDKFWVVELNREDMSTVPPELKGLRTFLLPREQDKLIKQLLKPKSQISVLRSLKSFSFSSSGATGHKHMKLPNLASHGSQLGPAPQPEPYSDTVVI